MNNAEYMLSKAEAFFIGNYEIDGEEFPVELIKKKNENSWFIYSLGSGYNSKTKEWEWMEDISKKKLTDFTHNLEDAFAIAENLIKKEDKTNS